VRSQIASVLAGGLILSCVVPVKAAEYGFGVGYSARHTDNALRTPPPVPPSTQEPVSDVEHNLTATGNIRLKAARWDIAATSGIEFESYANDTFDQRSVETLYGSAIYTFLPQRLTWTTTDTLQDTIITALLPTTPDNLEQTNQFSTGPDVTWRISTGNTVGFLARYENDWYEQSDFLSNDRAVGELNWRYRISEPASFILRYRYENLRFKDNVPGVDYVEDQLTAGFEGQLGPSVNYRIESGQARVRQDLHEEFQTRVGTAQLTRQIAKDASLSISLSSDISDSGRSAQADPTLDPNLQLTGGNLGEPDIVHTRAANLSFNSTLGWLKYSLAATARDEDFLSSNQDVKETGGGLVLAYEFSQRLAGTASGNITRSENLFLFVPAPVSSVRVDDDITAAVGLQFRFQRHWAAGLSLLYDKRDSNDSTQSYVENSIQASISYRYTSQRITAGE
jgi:hypothetical protein